MVQVEWSSKYSVGDETLDEQHKYILHLINKIESDSNEKVLFSIIDELTDYISYHFTTEEEALEQINYSDLKMHKKMHQSFSNEVEVMARELQLHNLKPAQLSGFLLDWLINHIEVVDMRYKEQLIAAKTDE